MNIPYKIFFLLFGLLSCSNTYAQNSDSIKIEALHAYNSASYLKLKKFYKLDNGEAFKAEFDATISYNDSCIKVSLAQVKPNFRLIQKLQNQKYSYMDWLLQFGQREKNDDVIAFAANAIKYYLEYLAMTNDIAYVKICNISSGLMIKYDYLLEANTLLLQTQGVLNRNPTFKQSKEGLLFLQAYARYFTASGSNYKANIYYTKLIYQCNEMLKTEAWKGNNDLLLALGASHSDIAKLYQDDIHFNTADSLYKVALHYYDISLGKDSKEYTSILSHKLYNEISYYIKNNHDYDFEKYEEQCIALLDKLAKFSGKKSTDYARFLIPLMELYWDNKSYDLAAQLLSQSLEVERAQNAIFSHHYKKLIVSYAGLSEARGIIDSAFYYYQESNQLTIDHIRAVFASASEQQQKNLIADLRYKFFCFYSFGDRNLEHNLPLLAEAFVNVDIAFKGLSLEKTTNVKKIALNSNDSLFKDLYIHWLNARQTLFKAMNSSSNTSIEQDIRIYDLKQQVENFGSLLGAKSRSVEHAISTSRLIDFKKIKNSLKADEACVDFIHFPYNNGKTWDGYDLYYAAIILPDQAQPILIKLGTNQDLEELLGNEINKNGTNYISEDYISKDLYDLIWAPLEEHLESSKQIYVCPTGLLHKVAFNSLLNNDEERLLQVYDLHYINSLRNIIHIKEHKKEKENHKICLVGAANFDSFEKEKSKKTAVVDTVLNQLSPDDQRAHTSSFSYLQGTKIEINQIEHLFKKEQWTIHKLDDVAATEEAIKALGQGASPQILHIASHGFFFDKQYKGFDCGGCMLGSIGSKPPLYRSGIALTGANKVWLGRERDSTHQEDGILTAYEVANMNLSQTELVVLSACETGRGDLGAEGGVLGLQRAFKLAGAKQLIFSLWKVPDRQTAELMKLFYNYYSESENSHLAFQKAQRDMSKKYNNPYYWAAFVLLE